MHRVGLKLGYRLVDAVPLFPRHKATRGLTSWPVFAPAPASVAEKHSQLGPRCAKFADVPQDAKTVILETMFPPTVAPAASSSSSKTPEKSSKKRKSVGGEPAAASSGVDLTKCARFLPHVTVVTGGFFIAVFERDAQSTVTSPEALSSLVSSLPSSSPSSAGPAKGAGKKPQAQPSSSDAPAASSSSSSSSSKRPAAKPDRRLAPISFTPLSDVNFLSYYLDHNDPLLGTLKSSLGLRPPASGESKTKPSLLHLLSASLKKLIDSHKDIPFYVARSFLKVTCVFVSLRFVAD